MGTAIPNVHRTRPVVFSELTRHHNTWGKIVSFSHFPKGFFDPGKEKCDIPPEHSRNAHSGGSPLTLTPE